MIDPDCEMVCGLSAFKNVIPESQLQSIQLAISTILLQVAVESGEHDKNSEMATISASLKDVLRESKCKKFFEVVWKLCSDDAQDDVLNEAVSTVTFSEESPSCLKQIFQQGAGRNIVVGIKKTMMKP